jgi:hypothetical protein
MLPLLRPRTFAKRSVATYLSPAHREKFFAACRCAVMHFATAPAAIERQPRCQGLGWKL